MIHKTIIHSQNKKKQFTIHYPKSIINYPKSNIQMYILLSSNMKKKICVQVQNDYTRYQNAAQCRYHWAAECGLHNIKRLQHQIHVKMRNAERSKRRGLHIQVQKHLHFFEPSMIIEAVTTENQKPLEIVN